MKAIEEYFPCVQVLRSWLIFEAARLPIDTMLSELRLLRAGARVKLFSDYP